VTQQKALVRASEGMEGEWPQSEQELKLEAMFANLTKVFKKLKKASDPEKIHGMLKEITHSLKDGKA
jgi:hypothetical protein